MARNVQSAIVTPNLTMIAGGRLPVDNRTHAEGEENNGLTVSRMFHPCRWGIFPTRGPTEDFKERPDLRIPKTT